MLVIIHLWASQVALGVKNSPANAGDTGDAGWIPESERSPGGGNGQPTPVFLPGEFPWTEELGGLWSMGSHGLDMTEHLSTDEHPSFYSLSIDINVFVTSSLGFLLSVEAKGEMGFPARFLFNRK